MSDDRDGSDGDDRADASDRPDEESGRPEVERRAAEERTGERSDAPAATDDGGDTDETEGPDPSPAAPAGGTPTDDAAEGTAESTVRGEDVPASIESKLDRANESDPEAAVSLLRSARADLEEVADSLPEETAERLRLRIDRLERAFEESDEYGALLGAATNPEDEDAP